MRLRNIKDAKEKVLQSDFVIHNYKEYKGSYNKLFNNNNPIEIEIGMGKGTFIITKALQNPDINYIGIEKYDSVLLRALEKIDKEIPNLKFIRMDALEIDETFDKEIDRIYLNFSDPWPKDRHYKRRLSSEVFLKKYDSIFKDKKHITMKTDNRKLFEFSIISFTNYNYKINKLSLDLHKDDIPNIETEYENKFKALGPIYMIDIEK